MTPCCFRFNGIVATWSHFIVFESKSLSAISVPICHLCITMTEGYYKFQYQNAILGYQKTGAGPEALFIFHGFGQDHSAFNLLVEVLDKKFTLYSFDLFFHGKSKWLLDDKPLEKGYWAQIIHAFIAEHNIQRFSLMGFSLGSKFVLATLEAKAPLVNSVFLLAPDGIKTNFWYSLATYPIALRSLFKSMIAHPGRFETLVKMAKASRMVDKGLIRFAQLQMDTEEKRRQVYNSWVIFSPLTFEMRYIATLITTNSIRLSVILGKFDKVITHQNMKRLLERLPNYQLHILDTGHTGLIKQSVELLKSEL
ncbi:MAG: alpha/beta hydrolase [Cyclobacteriaceae bacterium]